MSATPPTSPLPAAEDNYQLECLMNLMELICPTMRLTWLTIHNLLEISIIKMIQENNLVSKRVLKTFSTSLQKFTKKFKVEMPQKLLTKNSCSKEHDLFTMWCQTSLESNVLTLLKNVWQKIHYGVFMWAFHIDYIHAVHDCSYSGNKCLCTKIQCLPTKRNIRKHYRMHYWYEQCIYLLNIFLQRPGRYFTLKSPGEIERSWWNWKFILPKIAPLERNQWWTADQMRITFLTNSPVNQMHILVEMLTHQAVQCISKVKDVIKEQK